MMTTGLANTPLINYFFYKQGIFIDAAADGTCFPILSIADGGNGQLVITTDDTTVLTAGVAITISGTTSYDGNYSIISLTSSTFNVSGAFVGTETGIWELATGITGANPGDPLDFGEIFFFETDGITPQDTFKDRDKTIPNTNPLILDAVGSAPPIYLEDNPYNISIFDKFNNLVATLENYFPEGDSVTPSTELPIENLLANYGFDVKINDNIFSVNTVPSSNDTTPVTLGWYWQITSTETLPKNTYRYIELASSGLPGNPKNELRMRSTSNTSGQTINNLYTILGTYNMFQNQQLVFAIITERISGTTDTLQLQLIRTKNGVEQTPIPIGSISITGSQTQQTLAFTVPSLSAAAFDNNDELRLVINLPLNEDFEYGFTGTWCQLSPDGLINISETAISTRSVKQWLNNGSDTIASDNNFLVRGLPTMITQDGFDRMPFSGSSFLGVVTAANYSSFAGNMVQQNDIGDGIEVIRNEIIGQTQGARLIDVMRANGLNQSRLTFIADSGVGNVVSVTLGIGTAENSTWTTTAGPRITINKAQDELIYALEARTQGNGGLRFTFVDNFNASTTPFNPQYNNGGGDVYDGPALPGSGAIISWIGTTNYISPLATNKNRFDRVLPINTVNPGSGSEPAVVDVSFTGVNFIHHKYKVVVKSSGSGEVDQYLGINYNSYAGFIGGERSFVPIAGPTQTSNELQEGFLSYNDIGNTPNPQGAIPPRVINFGPLQPSSGFDSFTARTGALSTAVVPLLGDETREEVARLVSETINTSWIYEITIVSVPNNGDVVDISNSQTDYILVYFDTASPPTNPDPTRKPIFIPFNVAQSTIDIAATTATEMNEAVMGIPRAADLGLRFPSELAYYMYF